MSIGGYSEDALVEQPAVALFGDLGWETANCFNEVFGPGGTLGRETPADVVLLPRLHDALRRLNPDLPGEATALAVEEITRDRSAMNPVQANRQVYSLLKNGVKVTFQTEGEQKVETVRVIDWDEPGSNDFFLASQFWISGDMYERRADLVGFVNGIPLLLVELKTSHRKLQNAYRNNIRDYKTAIPQLFWYNAFIMLANGSDAKIGSTTAEWEHYGEWKKAESESEQGVVSLETAIRGTCRKDRFLDLVESFIAYSDTGGAAIKLFARNHQFLGVNNAIAAVRQIRDCRGRLGVFWHTQGSGKSLSMIFFSQKILRKLQGNWTFLIVTDRQELDAQIYKTFSQAGAVTEPENAVRAQDGDHLKQLLREDHRYLFTLIHKFHTRDGEAYPKLSDRSDIIVITDEAHRSQYDEFAKNMRQALPNAAFIGFTGTPLMVGEEKTRQVFGSYVSIYNFKQSVDDGATVPLYYENRIPELQLTNEDLNEDIFRVIDDADLDEEQDAKLEQTIRRQYHLITRDDRLEKIAADLVEHFMGRGFRGKAMVVSIDRLTAARMYEKVKKRWQAYLVKLQARAATASPTEAGILMEKIKYMHDTDMAVVVSQSQNELSFFQEHGIDFEPHRRRMVREDLDTKFKNPDDPFRIVFVCAMWMTGFDVPSCSTIYLDKPMRNHTLMQTIARANRVFGEKVNGLIVDYVGIFRDLQRALAIYGSASGGGVREGEIPVVDKAELLHLLEEAIKETKAFCSERGVDLDVILRSEGFAKIKYIDDAAVNIAEIVFPELVDDCVEKIIMNDDLKRQYMTLAANVARLYKAILPDPSAHEYAAIKTLIAVIADKIRSLLPETDIDDVMAAITQVLDESIAAEGYVMPDGGRPQLVDLSQIDFEALKAHFDKGKKRTEAERLRKLLSDKVAAMIALNHARIDFYEELQKMIDDYNSGAANVEEFFRRLMHFAQRLNEEDKRGLQEGLLEEELAVFDLLTRPDMKLSKKEKNQVKMVARELLEKLKVDKLVLDWKKRLQTRAAVLVTIEQVLDTLPRIYSPDIYRQKCDVVYHHVYDSYYGQNRSIYAVPSA